MSGSTLNGSISSYVTLGGAAYPAPATIANGATVDGAGIVAGTAVNDGVILGRAVNHAYFINNGLINNSGNGAPELFQVSGSFVNNGTIIGGGNYAVALRDSSGGRERGE